MRLSANDAAPSFEAMDWKGNCHRLEDFAGKRTWLAFFRYASCPLCNVRIGEMRAAPERWPKLNIAAVFQSPAASMAQYVGQQEPPFPLLCDPEEKLYAAYRLEKSTPGFWKPTNLLGLAKAAGQGFLPGKMEGTLTRLPADFLIDEEGRIVDAFYADDIAGHIPLGRVDAFASV